MLIGLAYVGLLIWSLGSYDFMQSTLAVDGARMSIKAKKGNKIIRMENAFWLAQHPPSVPTSLWLKSV